VPAAQSLIFHPFVLLVHFAPLAFSIALLYQVQFWIALVSTWAVCRHLLMQRWVAAVCVFTYALCSVTIQLQTDFWPDYWVVWTLAPLLLFLLLKLIESDTWERRAFYSVASGLCGGLMVLDGFIGVVPVFALGFAAFLIGSARLVRPVLPWIGLALVVLLAASSTQLFDLALENTRSSLPHSQEVIPFHFRHFLFYPHDRSAHGARNVAFGFPFVVLVLLGLLWVRKSARYVWGLRLAVVVSFVAGFLPVGWNIVVSNNWVYGYSLTLFSIFLAGVTLQRLWERLPRLHVLLLVVAGLQVAILAYGFNRDFYEPGLKTARSYLNGGTVETLKNTFKNREIYRYFERRPDHSSTRVLMIGKARDRLWRRMNDYTASAWQWHGLRLVNGQLRGVDVTEFQRMKKALHGDIRGEHDLSIGADDLPLASDVLDILNVGYVLAKAGDEVAKTLVPVRRFTLPAATPPGSTTIVAYRNPTHWGDAVVVSPRAKRLTTFEQRPDCAIPGLLCDDLSSIVPLRRPAGVTAQRWKGTTLDVRLAASSKPRVLMVSQMYRPGWHAKLSDGQTINGYRLFGAVTGFDIPPGVRHAEIAFRPTGRIAFAALSWATVLLSIVFLVGVTAARWPSRRTAGEGE
jgi:hypothetical protein